MMIQYSAVAEKAFKSIKQINKELQNNNIINLDYLLLRMSSILGGFSTDKIDKITEVVITEVIKLLIRNSSTYREICDNPDYSEEYRFINNYMEKVLKYYDNLMLTNQEKFDRYVEFSNGKIPKDKIIKQEHLDMTIEDIQSTMNLLNEAVRNYYEIYNNKSLIATFSDEQIIEFKMKESELAHLLGIKLQDIVNDEEWVKLLNITEMEKDSINDRTFTLDPNRSAAVDILHRIVHMSKDDILNYENDRLKKLDNHKYDAATFSEDKEGKLRKLKFYSKINARSKAFINFRPMEEMSMVLNLPKGHRIFRNYSTEPLHSLLVTKNNLSEQYKYSTLIINADTSSEDYRTYFQSLLIKTPDEYSGFQKVATPSITTEVALETDEGNGGSGAAPLDESNKVVTSRGLTKELYKNKGRIVKIFTEEQQRKFFEEVQKDFENLNFNEIVYYFKKNFGNGFHL